MEHTGTDCFFALMAEQLKAIFSTPLLPDWEASKRKLRLKLRTILYSSLRIPRKRFYLFFFSMGLNYLNEVFHRGHFVYLMGSACSLSTPSILVLCFWPEDKPTSPTLPFLWERECKTHLQYRAHFHSGSDRCNLFSRNRKVTHVGAQSLRLYVVPNRVAFLRTPCNVVFSIAACTLLTIALDLGEVTEMRRSKGTTDSKNGKQKTSFVYPHQYKNSGCQWGQ